MANGIHQITATGVKMARGIAIHDRLRGRVRAEYDRPGSPTEAIVDRQSVATATMVHSLCWFGQRKTR